MNSHGRMLASPRSLVKVGGSRALVECPAVTRAVGRSATDSETFWFTDWDWDTQAIWATVRGFFDAYNSGCYDECLDYISQAPAGGQSDDAIDLLRRAAQRNGHITVEAITDLVISGSGAAGTVDQIISSNVASQNMRFIKEKGSWRISWPILCTDNGFATRD